MERTDDDGIWTSPDDGVTWFLTEPSQAWLDAQATPETPALTTVDLTAEDGTLWRAWLDPAGMWTTEQVV